MLLSEPPPSQWDLRFSLFGFPVRVHPFFWLIALVLGVSLDEMRAVLIWIVAVFLGILVHELGHAFLMRLFGLRPWIVLYGLGGLTCHDPSQLAYSRADTSGRQISISLAGPGTGFLLVAVIVGILLATGQTVDSRFGFPFGISVYAVGLATPTLNLFVNFLLFVCLAWGLLNLLPIYPLDGGQVAREIFLRFNPSQGIRRSLILSLVTASIMTGVAVLNLLQHPGSLGGGSLFIPLLFGYLAYSSYAMLQAYGGGRPRW